MTVPAGSLTRKSFAPDGVTYQFPLTGLKFKKAADLLVTWTSDTGAEQLLTPATGFSITGNKLAGQAVLRTASLFAGGTLLVRRRTPARQDHSFTDTAEDRAKDFEAALDDVVRQFADVGDTQNDIKADLDRAVKVPPLSQQTADQLVSTVIQNGLRDMGLRAADPLTRADGTPNQPGDKYYNTLAQEVRYRQQDGVLPLWASGTAPNSSPVNAFASNPVLASGVSGNGASIQLGFTPQLPAGNKIIRWKNSFFNPGPVEVWVDGQPPLPLYREENTELALGELPDYPTALVFADRLILLNPRERLPVASSNTGNANEAVLTLETALHPFQTKIVHWPSKGFNSVETNYPVEVDGQNFTLVSQGDGSAPRPFLLPRCSTGPAGYMLSALCDVATDRAWLQNPYEESGDFTPVIVRADTLALVPGVSGAVGRYRLSGGYVEFWCAVSLAGEAGNSAFVAVSGLPYPIDSAPRVQGSISAIPVGSPFGDFFYGEALFNTTRFNIWRKAPDTVATPIQLRANQAVPYLDFTGRYRVRLP